MPTWRRRRPSSRSSADCPRAIRPVANRPGGNGASGPSLAVDSDDSSSELDISPSDGSLLEEGEVLLTLGRVFSLGLRDGGGSVVIMVLPVARIDSNSADARDSKSALLSDNSFGREDDEDDNLGVEG